jgi:hypothetical protein
MQSRSGVFATASHSTLQNLLSGVALQLHEGCAHIFDSFEAIRSSKTKEILYSSKFFSVDRCSELR